MCQLLGFSRLFETYKFVINTCLHISLQFLSVSSPPVYPYYLFRPAHVNPKTVSLKDVAVDPKTVSLQKPQRFKSQNIHIHRISKHQQTLPLQTPKRCRCKP